MTDTGSKQRTQQMDEKQPTVLVQSSKPVVLSETIGMDTSGWRLSLASSLDDSFLCEQLEKLSRHSLEPNPFFTLPFLKPAISNLANTPVHFLCLWKLDAGFEKLVLFMPVVKKTSPLRRKIVLETWTHNFAPLGTPLIAAKVDVEATLNALSKALKNAAAEKYNAVIFKLLPKRSQVSIHLHSCRELADRCLCFGASARAGYASNNSLQQAIGKVSGKRKQRLNRAMRELKTRGTVSFLSAANRADISRSLDQHLFLEASGWKGRNGTAILNNNSVLNFAEQTISNFSPGKECRIESLCVDDNPVASMILFEMQGQVYPWKIAFDENHADCSVGNLLASHVNQELSKQQSFTGLDSLANELNTTALRFWPDRLVFSDLVVGLGADAPETALSIAIQNERFLQFKRMMKRLLGRTL